MTTDDFLKQANKLYEAAIADLNDEDYVIDETKVKNIILSLTVMDFSEILQNEHKGFEYERLYVFGKDVTFVP